MRDEWKDTMILTWRCCLLSLRNPDTLLTSVMLPGLMMALFVFLFGTLIQIGDMAYVDYIVPGVLLQCVGQCSSTTSVMVCREVRTGMAGRLCILPIRRSSYLHGHVLEALTRNLITSLIVLIVAVILGFCPAFDPGGWLLALVLLICVILVFSWLAIIVGLLARSEEGASALSALAIILPYLSSGFVPAAAMPGPLAFFAQVQPLTPIIEVMRGALLGLSADPRMIMLAFGWCALLFIGFRLCGNRLLRHALSTQ